MKCCIAAATHQITLAQNCPFPEGVWAPPNTWFLGPTRVHVSDITTIGLGTLLCSTDRQTDHATSAAMRHNNWYVLSVCCGRYRSKLPTARTALCLALSLSLQSFTDVCSSLDNSATEKSAMNSELESALKITWDSNYANSTSYPEWDPELWQQCHRELSHEFRIWVHPVNLDCQIVSQISKNPEITHL